MFHSVGFGYTLQLDDEQDLSLDGGVFNLVSDVDCLAQDLKCRYLTVRGDDAIHPTVGLPYLDYVDEGFDGGLLESDAEAEGAKDPRVATVDEVTVTPDLGNRVVAIAATMTAVDGSTFDVTALHGRT